MKEWNKLVMDMSQSMGQQNPINQTNNYLIANG